MCQESDGCYTWQYLLGKDLITTTTAMDRRAVLCLALLLLASSYAQDNYSSGSALYSCYCTKESSNTNYCAEWNCDQSYTASCFSAESLVRTLRGTIPISKLKVGDKVEAVGSDGSIMFSDVIAFLDRKPQQLTKFVELSFSDNGDMENRLLRITKDHLMYKASSNTSTFGEAEMLFSSQLKIGDLVSFQIPVI